jgi:signal transduction histidine kinase
MEQVLLNLVMNARDAITAGGTIRIETWNSTRDDVTEAAIPSGNYVVLRVTDDGVGMDDETARRAFEPFFSSKSEASGTGLGLPTVHGVVEQAGGFIALHSAPGVGTVVTVYLRRSAQPMESATPVDAVGTANLKGTEVILLA